MDRPEAVARLDTILGASRIAHETVFELHRKVTVLRPTERSLELLTESARIATNELPAVLAKARRLRSQWSELSVLDPGEADRTLRVLDRELDRVQPKVHDLRGRQREIAREVRALVDEARS